MRDKGWWVFGVSSLPSPFLQHPPGAAAWHHPILGADLWPSPCWSKGSFFWLFSQISSVWGSVIQHVSHFAKFCVTSGFAEDLLCLITQSVSKVLNNIGLTNNHLCALLVTSHQLDASINYCLSAWQPLSLLPSNTIQLYCIASLLQAHFLFLGRIKCKIPMEKGNAKKFWRELVRDRKQSPKSCISTYNKKSKEWTILFSPREIVTTRFCCFVVFYWSRDTFQGSIGFMSTAHQAVISPKHCKNFAQYQLFFFDRLIKWINPFKEACLGFNRYVGIHREFNMNYLALFMITNSCFLIISLSQVTTFERKLFCLLSLSLEKQTRLVLIFFMPASKLF